MVSTHSEVSHSGLPHWGLYTPRLHAHSQGTSSELKLYDSAGASAGAKKCQDFHHLWAHRFDNFQFGTQHTIGLNLGLEDACSLAAPKYQLASEPTTDLQSSNKFHQLRLVVYFQVFLLQDRLEGRKFILNQKLKYTHQICLNLKQTYFNQIKYNTLMGF